MPAAPEAFAISVVDDQTGRGIPLVELRCVDQSLHVTDSHGLVAFEEPGLLNQSVYFHVQSHGYEFPADGFGYRGVKLQTTPGATAELRLRRINIAERLYRVTGAGIYRDTVRLGRAAPLQHPLLNAQVVGSDSVNTALFGGRLHWFWGDTNRASYPLGCFHVPGATSRLPADGGLAASLGVDLDYFTVADGSANDGFVADTARMPGDGPTWIDGLCVLRDSEQKERMFAKYVKVRKFLDVYQRGLVEFDPTRNRFEKVVEYDFQAPLYPLGHSFNTVEAGQQYIYFGNPYPLIRVRATPEALRDPSQYESFTCLAPGTRSEKPTFDRASDGTLRYAWKANTPPPTPREQAQWLKAKQLQAEEALLALRDIETGQPVMAHAGSVAYNDFRRRWVMITEQTEGSSYLGEIWYAEADTPIGPWVYARKIVTHDKYSFYNPKHHPMFDEQQGRKIYFEGTYSTFFSGAPTPTPLYDYNQVMYSLDLADERLILPVPIWRHTTGEPQRLSSGPPPDKTSRIAFMALDRPRADAVAMVQDASSESGRLTALPVADLDEASKQRIAFYALADEPGKVPPTMVRLWPWTHPKTGRHIYLIENPAGQVTAPVPAGFQRAKQPLCRVWRFPLRGEIFAP